MTDDAQVRDNPDKSRYEIWLGEELAGFTEYALHGAQADFVHTEVDEKFGGHGIASELIQVALDDARRRGWQVMPYCRFVRKFIAKHPDFLDLVPEDHHAQFGLRT